MGPNWGTTWDNKNGDYIEISWEFNGGLMVIHGNLTINQATRGRFMKNLTMAAACSNTGYPQ